MTGWFGTPNLGKRNRIHLVSYSRKRKGRRPAPWPWCGIALDRRRFNLCAISGQELLECKRCQAIVDKALRLKKEGKP